MRSRLIAAIAIVVAVPGIAVRTVACRGDRERVELA